jgi:hypothetical protein
VNELLKQKEELIKERDQQVRMLPFDDLFCCRLPPYVTPDLDQTHPFITSNLDFSVLG